MIKGSIQKKKKQNISIVNTDAPNIGASHYIMP